MDAPTGMRLAVKRKENATFIHLAAGDTEAERRLDFFIGAGVLGRSYASILDGFLLQAPVSYYTSTRGWDLSPGFQGFDHLPLTRPIEPACLNCHASSLLTRPDTVNGYQNPPFAETGVSCERCHGPGETHITRMKSGDTRRGSGIVNPAKLSAAERDSVCAQCHLVGVIRISKTGAGRYEPGKRFFDTTSAFLWSSGAHQSASNTHFEQLVSSACWRKSAGRLWCGSCHSAHNLIAENSRSAFYRRRCLTCHTVNAPDCSLPAGSRRAVSDDCVACHMPSKPITTVEHSVQVDHTIPRIPGKKPEASAAAESSAIDEARLIPFPGSSGDDRELGLAYASEAIPRNNRFWGERAFVLLKKVAAAHPEDASVTGQLAQLYDRMGQEQQACNYFEQAVKQGPAGAGALVNLGTCRAKGGDIQGAIKLWLEAVRQNPALEAARLNLAIAQSQLGEVKSARINLQTALRYDPFSPRVRELLRSMAAQ